MPDFQSSKKGRAAYPSKAATKSPWLFTIMLEKASQSLFAPFTIVEAEAIVRAGGSLEPGA